MNTSIMNTSIRDTSIRNTSINNTQSETAVKRLRHTTKGVWRAERRPANTLLFTACLSLGSIGVLCGQTPHSAAPSLRSQSADGFESIVPEDETLDWLSRDQYSRRQQATLQMWRDREQSREQVQEAARNPDPEVSGRAKWILRQWRRGALPDTPPEIARLLQASDGPAAIERLLEGGQFTAAVVAIEESAGTADREAIQSRIASALQRRFPIYVHKALVGESLSELLKLVDLVADSKELALCRIELMQQLGIEITADALLPSSASLWSPSEREQAETLLWVILGQMDRAMEVASRSTNDDLLRQCRLIAGRWTDAAADSARLARQTQTGDFDETRLWCLTLIAADRSGDEALRAESISVLTGIEIDDSQESQLAAEMRWKCLASHGEVDAALDIVSRTSPDAAASVCMDASRITRAFEILEYPLDRIDLDLDRWIAEAIESQRQFSEADLTPEIRRMLALMQCLISIGRDDAAWSIARKLSESDVNIDTLRLREFVLSTLTMTRRTDWVVPLAVGEQDKSLSPQSHNTIARILPDCDLMSFEIVVQALATLMPGATLKQRVGAAAELFRGELPEQFDPATGFDRLYDFVTSPRPTQSLRGRVLGRQGILANLNIVLLFARHGEAGLATQCLQKLIQTSDVSALFFMAEQELEGGRTDTAEALFEAVFESVTEQTRVSGRFGGADDVTLAVKAKIGLWVIARRNGDELESQELEREIRLALCSPSTRLRSSVAEYLGEQEETPFAMDVFARVLPMALLGNDEQTGLYDVARSYAPLAKKTQPEEAARWFDLAVGGSLDSIDFRPGAYITLPLFVRRWAIEAAIEREDVVEVQRHVERILQLDPLDIDFAERLLPQMRTRGMGELADQTLDRILDRGLAYGRRFPFDAMTCNNLAWVAAMNQRRLEEALELARLAVSAEPESAIYRDTLAEVLFLLGRQREALQVEHGCLLDDPGQWHLHEQIEKYSRSMVEGE